MMLKNCGEWGNSCLVSDISGKISNFSSLSMMIVVSFLYIFVYQVEEVSLYPQLSESFYFMGVEFCQMLFPYLLM